MEEARIVGYVMSGSTPSKIMFVVRRDRRVAIGRYYAFKHPFFGPAGPPVFIRVYEITAVNEEMESGRAAVLASSSGLVPDYPSELEYLLAECEVLGYRNAESDEICPLEAPPSTMTPVYEPTAEELASFVGDTARGGTPVRVGLMRGLGAALHLDLDAVARGHMFVAGMTRSGKSVSGDSIIVVYDAKEDRIWVGPIADFAALVERTGVGYFRYLTLALDKRSMKPVWAAISAVHVHRPPRALYEVRTETGRKLVVTGDHSLLVYRNGRIFSVKTTSVRPGRDYLIAPWGEGALGRVSVDVDEAQAIGVIAATGYCANGREEAYLFGVPPGFELTLASLGAEWADLVWPNSLIVRNRLVQRVTREGVAYALRFDQRSFTAALLSALSTVGVSSTDGGEILVPTGDSMDANVISTLSAIAGIRTTSMSDGVVALMKSDMVQARSRVMGAADGGASQVLKVPRVFGANLQVHNVLKNGALVEREKLIRILEEIQELKERASDKRRKETLEKVERMLVRLLRAKVSFELIENVRPIAAREEYVYDLSVVGHENFLANGVFVHNSSFTLNLLRRGLRARPCPRFIVLDRRGEYEELANDGGVVVEYRAFLPPSGALRPEDVARRAGIEKGTRAWELTVMAAEEAAEAGDLTVDGIVYRARTLAARMGVRDRTRILRQVEAKLRRAAKEIERSRGEGLDIVSVLREHPAVVIDLSLDDYYDDQFVALRKIIRRLVSHAVSRRKAGDFAAIVVVEEAQYLAPERGSPVVGDPYGSGVASALTEAISQAGGYNLGFIIVTQRPSYVSKGVISQCNTVAAFRLQSGNDQEAIARYTEAGETVVRFLPALRDHEAVMWGMASPISFPVVVRVDVETYPAKASARPSEAWRRMMGASLEI